MSRTRPGRPFAQLFVILSLILAVEGAARGQAASDIEIFEMRRKAEQFEKEGRYAACGKTYLDIFERDPTSARAEELLYNAGVCLEHAPALDDAIAAYEKLEQLAPHSPLTRRALVRRAQAHEAMAQFEEAAGVYERYATRFAGEKDAPLALSMVVLYRKALGQYREATQGIESFVRNYGKRRREEAAAALFELANIHELEGRDDKVLQSHRRYLKRVGRSGGLDRLVVANAKIGLLLWKRSCRGSTLDGLCVQAGRHKAPNKPPALPRQCGATSLPAQRARPRNQRVAQEARRHLQAALDLAKRGQLDRIEDPARRAHAQYWLGAARFTLLEQDVEELLSLPFPRGLDFPADDPKKSSESSKKFAAWLRELTSQMNELETGYRALVAERGGGATWAIASAARMGDASMHMATLLRTAAIPPSVRSGAFADEATKAYCAALRDQADPIESQAVASYGFCLEQSARLHHMDESSARCARQLARLRPEDYPLPAEVRGAATAQPDLIARASLIDE